MAKPLTRRFHQVLGNTVYSAIAWLLAMLVAVQMESGTKEFRSHPEHSYTFCLATLPLYCVVMFGCYSLICIGYHMIILCKFT